MFLRTDTAGSFLADNPAGSTFNFGGASIGKFWMGNYFCRYFTGNAYIILTLSTAGLLIILTWNTSQEFNSNYFGEERSIDGIHFTEIGEVKAEATAVWREVTSSMMQIR